MQIICFQWSNLLSNLFNGQQYLGARSHDRCNCWCNAFSTSAETKNMGWAGNPWAGNMGWAGNPYSPNIPGWWFGTWLDYDFPFSWDCHHPNWRNHIFQRGRYTTNQIIWRNVQQDLVPLLTPVYQKTGYDVPICQVLRIVALYSISWKFPTYLSQSLYEILSNQCYNHSWTPFWFKWTFLWN